MAVKTSELLNSLKADLKASEVLKRDLDIQIEGWKSAYDGKPYGNEEKGKSAIVSRDIKKQGEWQHASIIDPFVSTADIVKCNPITFEDGASARQNELLLNTQFCRKFDRYNFMTKAVKVLDREGTVVVQTGWEYLDKEVESTAEVLVVDEFGNEYLEEQEVTETIVLKNQPTAKVCRNQDIYIDPTCQDDMSNCQFVIHRYESDLSTLRVDGRYKNLERVAKTSSGSDTDDYVSEDETNFRFSDDARKKHMVYEYWGNYDMNEDGVAEAIVCAWIGDTIIRLESNPYPDGKPPFIVVPFNSVPFQMHGEANAELVGDNQKIKTAILRGIIDNMAQSTNGQVGMLKGSMDIANRKKFLSGKNFEYNGNPNAFWQGSYNQIPGSAFDMLGLMNNEIESITGVKSFSGGISGNSLGSTATGARGALDATSVRRMNIVRNIAENLVKPLMRKWMSYNAEFLEDEEVVRVTNEEFVPIRRDDLEGNIDIDITVSTAEDNAAKAQELAFLIQTMGTDEDPEIRKMLRVEHLRLMKLPEAAKKLEDYQPQPDPMQEQAKKLEMERLALENEKLKADIADKYARAGENEVDKEYKAWKAEVEKAKARKLASEADLADLKYLKDDNQYDRELDTEKFERQRQHDLDMMVIQNRFGGKNEQIGLPR